MARALSQIAAQTITTGAIADAEIQEGKLFGTLSYVVPLFLLVPLLKRDNAVSLFHAKQALTLWIANIAVSMALTVVMMVIPVAFISTLFSLAYMVVAIAMTAIGAIHAWNGRVQALPVIGAKGDVLLAGVTTK